MQLICRMHLASWQVKGVIIIIMIIIIIIIIILVIIIKIIQAQAVGAHPGLSERSAW